jgi:hypothetical protein
MDKENLTNAISAHAQWKARLNASIESGTSDFDPEIVQLPNKCEFGKWLYGDTLSDDIKESEYYKKAVDLHAQFHTEAAKVLSLALAGNKDEATKHMDAGSHFANLSSELTNTIESWIEQ